MVEFALAFVTAVQLAQVQPLTPAYRGHLDAVYIDSWDKEPSGPIYSLLTAGGEKLRLLGNLKLPMHGSLIEVSGSRRGQEIDVASVTVLEEVPLPPSWGEHKVAVVMVTADDHLAPAYSRTELMRIMSIGGFTGNKGGGPSRSVDQFFREASYGVTSIRADVFGPYQVPMQTGNACPYGLYDVVGNTAFRIEIGEEAAAEYTHRLIVMPVGHNCGWTGRATLGGNPAHVWINGRPGDATFAHELGHNFGLRHSHSQTCTSGGVCVVWEYGDDRDVMGSCKSLLPSCSFNAAHKLILQWIDEPAASSSLTVTTPGTYWLDSFEHGFGTKVLVIPTNAVETIASFAHVKTYFVEAKEAGVFLHTMPKLRDFSYWTYWPDRINLIDLAPTTAATDFTLNVGQTYTADGFTIRLLGQSVAGASVDVAVSD